VSQSLQPPDNADGLLLLSTALPAWIFLIVTGGSEFPGSAVALALCVGSLAIERLIGNRPHALEISMLLASVIVAAVRITSN
jgi:hypothetical protein